MPAEKGNEPTLVITRVFDAPRELVFRVWTDPAHVTHWWGPRGFTAPVVEIDLRPGGAFRFCMQAPDGSRYWNKGVYQEIIAPERIVSTIYFSDEHGNIVPPTHYGLGADFPSEMHDVVTFEPQDGGRKTLLTLRRDTPLSISKRYMEDQGWSQSLDRVAAEVARAGASEGKTS
jgi:uncharacterized protein YndB with AHSA1/START domain